MRIGKILATILLMIMLPCLAWAANLTFTAQLTGDQVVPPVKTEASGEARFHMKKGGKALKYTLMVKNLTDVSMAHIHLGSASENGPVAVWLYPAGPPPVVKSGKFSGVLAKGTITEKDLLDTLKGQPLSALIEAIEAGKAYVNVHTTAHPDGEIRGQIGRGKTK